ncbi:hypothetical protein ILYODFUR_028693 [Ilyodon furcidens]|uniref:DAD domain-containing protein n=1 Tax=Ilyodon furcidens TaxID=33524 RepID=A0ABV0UW92_9TELE
MADENDETGVMDSLLEALQSGAAFRERRKRVPRPRDNYQQTISPSSFRQVLRPVNYGSHLEGVPQPFCFPSWLKACTCGRESNYTFLPPLSLTERKSFRKCLNRGFQEATKNMCWL